MDPCGFILTGLTNPCLSAAEAALFFLLAAGVTVMVGLGFVFWIACNIVRLVALLLTGRRLTFPDHRRPAETLTTLSVCPDPVCRGVNPVGANFCRQCGRTLRAGESPS